MGRRAPIVRPSKFLVSSKTKEITRETWKRLGGRQNMLEKLKIPDWWGAAPPPTGLGVGGCDGEVGVGRPYGSPRKPDLSSKALAEPAGALGWDNAYSLHPVDRFVLSSYYRPGLGAGCWRHSHSSGREGKINT